MRLGKVKYSKRAKVLSSLGVW